MSAPSLKTRLRKIAATLQVCQKHGTPLVCAPCWWTWSGTEEEFWELSPLVKRLEPYCPDPLPSGQTCADCGRLLYCQRCSAALDATFVVPVELFTAEEWSTYDRLMAHLKCRAERVPNGWHQGFYP